MPVVAMPDGTQVSFPDEMPPDQIKSLIAEKFPNEVKAAAPQSTLARAGGAISKAFEKPPSGPSFIGMGKQLYDMFAKPLPETVSPGMRREDYTDIPGSEQPNDPLIQRTTQMAAATLLPSAGSAARRGADPSALGAGFVPRSPGGTAAPTKLTVNPAQGAYPRSEADIALMRAQGATAADIAAAQAPPAGKELLSPIAQETVSRATDIGVPIPRYMVDDNRLTQGLAAGLQNIPGAGDRIAKAASETMQGLGGVANRAKDAFGTGSAAVAGSEAKDAISTWVTDSSKDVAKRVYDKVDALVNPAVTTELTATQKAAQAILARRETSKIPGKSTAVETVLDAATTPGGLNYEGVKGLRSFLGEMTPQEMVSQGVKAAEVKQLYSALSQDLRTSVLNSGGPGALKAFEKANRIFDAISDRRDAVAKIIGTKGDLAPEAVFARLAAMAGSKSSADIAKLSQARKVIGPEAWDQVASAVIARLGRDAQGDFSITRFLGPNGYAGLSEPGKAMLFRSTGKDQLAKSLDDLSFVSRQIEDKLKQFHNPSGTAKSLTATGTVFGIIRHPIETLAVMVGGKRMADVLSEPATARATADWLKSLNTAMTAPHTKAAAAVRRASENLAGIMTGKEGGNPQQLAIQLQLGIGANN